MGRFHSSFNFNSLKMVALQQKLIFKLQLPVRFLSSYHAPVFEFGPVLSLSTMVQVLALPARACLVGH